MILPIFQSQDKDLMLMQTRWAQMLNRELSNPLLGGHIIKSVSLINGLTSINHLLGQQLQGWFLTSINAAASVYEVSANAETLVLHSNAVAQVDIYVF